MTLYYGSVSISSPAISRRRHSASGCPCVRDRILKLCKQDI